MVNPFTRSSVRTLAVTKRIGIFSSRARSSSAISKPSLLGSITSSTHTSGCIFLKLGRTLAPSLSINTSKPRVSRLSLTIFPRNSSSSAYSTFILRMVAGYFNGEPAACSFLALHADLAALTLQHIRDIAEAQAIAFYIVPVAGRYAEKFLEDPAHIGRRNAQPIIGDGQEQLPLLGSQVDLDEGLLPAIFQRIIQ